jgi:hypothetical protein
MLKRGREQSWETPRRLIVKSISPRRGQRVRLSASFGLFSAPEIVAPVIRADKCSLAAACERYGLPVAGWVLAVPNALPKVAAHLAGTEYAQGGWKDTLRQCPHKGIMIAHPDINHRTIDGTKQRCTLIVLDRYHGAPER